MNRALSFVMMRNGTRASYGRKLGNSYSSFKRVKKIKLHFFKAEWLITTAHNIKPSMPPGGCETEKILWYHREMVLDSRKSGFTNLSTSGFLRKMGKWPKKYWLKEKKAEKDWLASWSLWVWLRAIQNVWFMHLQLFPPYPPFRPSSIVRHKMTLRKMTGNVLTERNPSRLAGLVFQEFKSKSL